MGYKFSQLFNVPRISDIMNIEIHKAELLVNNCSPFGAEIAIVKMQTSIYRQEEVNSWQN
jgi:hypothetical protein